MTTVRHFFARRRTFIAGIGFFQAMAILLLLLTLVGFAPTFYLRPWFESSPLPLRFHVHGLFTTLWMMVFLSQTLLVARGKNAVHRRMGMLSIAVAGSLVVSGLAILYFLAAGSPENGWELAAVSSLVWGNIASLSLFCIFVGSGIALRARAQTHKRMMLFATLSIMGPPLARIGHFDTFRISESLMVNDAVYGLGGVLALYLLVLVHDLRVLGLPHATLLLAAPLHFGLIVIAGIGLGGTEFGQELVLALSQSDGR